MAEKDQLGKSDQRLLARLEQSVSLDFPNPERVGCPDSSVLRDLALRKLRLAEVEPWLSHLSACSPCFQEFSYLRKQAAHGRRRTYAMVSIAAVLLFAVAGWLWMKTVHPNRSMDTEILDLRELIVAVDQDVERAEGHPLQLHRGTRHLTLQLPAAIHREEQALEVALLRETGDAVLTSHGATHLEGELAVLTVDLDVGSVQPGRYYLGLRHPGANWTLCPLVIV